MIQPSPSQSTKAWCSAAGLIGPLPLQAPYFPLCNSTSRKPLSTAHALNFSKRPEQELHVPSAPTSTPAQGNEVCRKCARAMGRPLGRVPSGRSLGRDISPVTHPDGSAPHPHPRLCLQPLLRGQVLHGRQSVARRCTQQTPPAGSLEAQPDRGRTGAGGGGWGSCSVRAVLAASTREMKTSPQEMSVLPLASSDLRTQAGGRARDRRVQLVGQEGTVGLLLITGVGALRSWGPLVGSAHPMTSETPALGVTGALGFALAWGWEQGLPLFSLPPSFLPSWLKTAEMP